MTHLIVKGTGVISRHSPRYDGIPRHAPQILNDNLSNQFKVLSFDILRNSSDTET
jgi:hypothetical protein